jgi:hypothetical protein
MYLGTCFDSFRSRAGAAYMLRMPRAQPLSEPSNAEPPRQGLAQADEDDEEDEEQTSLLGAEASDSGGDVAPSGGEASIYANEDEEEEPDACKVIVSLIPIVYAPSLLYSLGEAITDPVLLLYATDTLGTSVSTAAFAVSANHYGKLLSNVPAGMLYTRLGPGPSMFVAAVRHAVASTPPAAAAFARWL